MKNTLVRQRNLPMQSLVFMTSTYPYNYPEGSGTERLVICPIGSKNPR